MRPEEVTGEKPIANGHPPFSWADIDLEHARSTVRVEVAKKGDQRTIRLQPVAVQWLRLADEYKNPLPPVNERRLVDEVCALIGLDEWLKDGLRKCCATHLRNVYKLDYEVIRDMGNSVRVLLSNYPDLHITPEESDDYWAITPKRVLAYMETPEWQLVLKAAAEKRRLSSTTTES